MNATLIAATDPAALPRSDVFVADGISIPGWVGDFSSYRRWATSDSFPQSGRIAYLDGVIFVDPSMEELFTHNQVKGEPAEATAICRQRAQRVVDLNLGHERRHVVWVERTRYNSYALLPLYISPLCLAGTTGYNAAIPSTRRSFFALVNRCIESGLPPLS